VSALEGEGVGVILDRVAGALPHPPLQCRLLIPFERPEILPRLYRQAEVLAVEDHPEGTLVHARVWEADLPVVGPFVLGPA
jgi:GTP-binding protein HflX